MCSASGFRPGGIIIIIISVIICGHVINAIRVIVKPYLVLTNSVVRRDARFALVHV